MLITDDDPAAAIPAEASFGRVVRHRFRLPGNLRKSEILDLLPRDYDSFLLLDADTRILMDISLGFEKAERFGIAAVMAPAYGLEHYFGFGERVLEGRRFHSRETMQYNSGVIFFSRKPRVWRVLRRWQALCSAEAQAPRWGREGDQPFLTLAMEEAGFNPYGLSPSYNYRNFGELAHGHIRIWHSHVPPPPDFNSNVGRQPFRRFARSTAYPAMFPSMSRNAADRAD